MQQPITILFDQTGNLDIFFQNINQAISNGAKSLFLLTADDNNFDVNCVNNFLKQIPIPIFGGIFPRIIHKTDCVYRGSIVCGLNLIPQIEFVYELSNNKTDPAKAIATFATSLKERQTVMIFVDGLSKNITNFIEKLYQHVGGNVKYLGGGAGSLTFKSKPCIYSNHGLLSDCAQLIGLDIKSLLSVEHGWEKFMGPFVITESQNNIIKMIDYQPAFQVYKNIIETNTPHLFAKENFFDIAKFFPFGIEMLDGSYVVRDPIASNDNKIVCVADVPENSVVYILKGNSEQLIASAANAADSLGLCSRTDICEDCPVLVFDCISRCLILGSRIKDELAAINSKTPCLQSHLIGSSTIGEIANYGSISLEFFNKTLVLGVFLRS